MEYKYVEPSKEFTDKIATISDLLLNTLEEYAKNNECDSKELYLGLAALRKRFEMFMGKEQTDMLDACIMEFSQDSAGDLN